MLLAEPKCTRDNEVFKDVGEECVCDLKTTTNCVTVNKPNCYCEAGYVRDDKGNCVPKSICPVRPPPKCGKNEIFSPCAEAAHCRSRCGVPEDIYCASVCVPDCICKPGYILNKEGTKCIPKAVCDRLCVKCAKNETFTDCENPCQPTCDDPEREPCPTFTCTAGCHCKPGYIREKDGGYCIKLADCKNCNSTCPENERLGCKNNCEKTCENPHLTPCYDETCILSCVCAEGYVRNSEGQCTLLNDCPDDGVVCGPNEIKEYCRELPCDHKCICKPGYERKTPEGECEPCDPKCPKPNTIIGCKNDCPKTCTEPDKAPCEGETCILECVCKDGYVLNSTGDCVLQEECTPLPPKCKRNEIYTSCKSDCPATCSNQNPTCTTKTCVEGCECAPGFVRKTIGGKCIPVTSCKNCWWKCPVNEEIGCENLCPQTCNNATQAPCLREQCKLACVCKKGFLELPDGSCGHPSECPLQCLKPNTEIGCKTSCPATCDDPEISCPPEPQCVSDCICKPGYVQNSDGDCVLQSECPTKFECTGNNEVYTKCRSDCPPTCANQNPICKTKKCVEGCECEPGFIREHLGGPCVRKSTCKNCFWKCPKNEETGCENLCPATCSNPNQEPCLREQCRLACVCQKGLVELPDGTCGPISACPQPEKCPQKGEVYGEQETCGTCDDPNAACPEEPGCYCKKGLVRQPDGTCKPLKKCPVPVQCKDDEVYQSKPSNCGTCENPRKQCTEEDVEGCYCKRGTVRYPNGTCAHFKSCPKPVECNEDEEYKRKPVNCGTCEDPTKKCDPNQAPGCYCKKGLVRYDDGTCGRPKSCPTPEPCWWDCPENEEVGCENLCPSTCDNIEPERCLSETCKLTCVCKPGMVILPDDTCGPVDQCPIPECKDGEEYGVQRKCGTCSNPNEDCPSEPGCYCKKGLVRYPNGTCGPLKKCPTPIQCRPDEEYKRNPTNCATCDHPRQKCDAEEVAGCFCKRGSVRYPDGSCGSAKNCPDVIECPEGEQYKRQPKNCGTCADPHAECPEDAPKGCYCRRGLVRYPDGSCGRARLCPDPITCGTDEEYQEFPRNCGNCENPNKKCDVNAEPACVCKKGLVRLPDGTCGRPKLCPEPVKCNKDEEPQNPPSNCATCDEPNKECTGEETAECYCKPGTVRYPDGSCGTYRNCPDKIECPPDEEYKTKPKNCATCEQPNKKCTEEDGENCYCKAGLVRFPDNTCGRYRNCPEPVTCPIDEEYSYTPNNCGTCANPNEACDEEDSEGCYCKEGLVRYPDGSCGRPKNCPDKQECSVDEEYKTKRTNCGTCQQPNKRCDDSEGEGCQCKSGLVRFPDNSCGRPRDCPDECPIDEEHEEFPTNCGTCANPNKECTESDRAGCYCIRGLVRYTDGYCGPARNCPDEKECPVDEQYNQHPKNCATCDHPYKRCDDDEPADCECKNGLVRFPDGTCGRPRDCPAPITCPPGSDYEQTPTNCGTCADPNKQCTDDDIEGCYCRDDLVRYPDGSCGTSRNCPDKHDCPIDEEYKTIPRNCGTCEEPSRQCDVNQPEGCVCKSGLVRYPDGFCGRPRNCPGHVECPDNEEYKKPTVCGTCEDTKKACDENAPEACNCKPGFVRHPNGRCKRPKECPPPIECREDEEYQRRPKNCGTCETPRQTCDYNEPAGCMCKRGTIRFPDGSCAPPSTCPPKVECPKREEHKTQPDNCATCEDPNKACTDEQEGCYCKRGLVRSNNGTCIHLKQCPPPIECPVGEVYRRKPTNCATCADTKLLCTGDEQPGCFCLHGTVRYPDGTCGNPRQCPDPVTCPTDEEYRTKPRNCATCDDPTKQCTEDDKEGCYCRRGLVRYLDGTCGNPKKCPAPVECRPDEEYKRKPKNCATCADPWQVCDSEEPAGCMCKRGTVRYPDGSCGNPKECPPPIECGTDEEYRTKPNNCGTCDDPRKQCTSENGEGCYCRRGYVRLPNGACGRVKSCPDPIECRSDEEYKRKPTNCATCADPWQLCDGEEAAGCFCKRGTVRFPNGTCAHASKCVDPRQCPTDEEYTTNPRNCATCDDPTKVCTAENVEGCYCRRGLVRYPDGTCGRLRNCPNTVACRPDEEFRRKPSNCGTCQDPRKVCDENEQPGCFCKRGTVRYPDGSCGSYRECPDLIDCKTDEEYRTKPRNCATCENPRQRCTSENVEGCYCRRGLVRYPDGSCGPLKNCPAPIECNDDEEYKRKPTNCGTCADPRQQCNAEEPAGCVCKRGTVRYPDGSCGNPRECPDLIECANNEEYRTRPRNCATCEQPDKKCTTEGEGCYCKRGFVRLSNGTCASANECPAPITCRDDEEYQRKPHNCGTCADPWDYCGEEDQPGCYCKRGTVRYPDGSCGRAIECDDPIDCPVDEEYRTKPKNCATCTEPNKICSGEGEGCYCRSGLVRQPDGTCKRPKRCPAPVDCKENEEYRRKPTNCATCAHPHEVCNEEAVEGCYCKKGYVRYPDGSCNLRRTCPKPIECQPDEEYKRKPNNCATCDEPRKQCTGEEEEGCQCKRGLVRYPDGSCGSPRTCPAPVDCGTNEEYRRKGRNCGTCENPLKECTEEDKAGCYCKRGYVRYLDGSCGRAKSCPAPVQCPANEEYRRNPRNCATCDDPEKECPEDQQAGCYCKHGFVRYADGKCGRARSCPAPIDCPTNEEYRKYPRNCATCDDPEKDCDVSTEQPGCYCKRDYFRNKDGKCVKTCPPPIQCGPNEVYQKEPSNCATCQNPEHECNLEEDLPGCYCKNNFVRFPDGTCGRKRTCPPPIECGPNEEFKRHPKNCRTCADPELECEDTDENKCVCKRDFVRQPDGSCGRLRSCPPPVECKANEEYRRTPRNCGTCDDPDKECTDEQPGCYCKRDFVRYADGSCGRPRSCPAPVECNAKKNEEYRKYPRNCATCSEPDKECEESDLPGCYCKRDYVRYPDGSCGREKTCPPPEECAANHEYKRHPRNCATCDDPRKECEDDAPAGCYCKNGLVKYPDGTCGPRKSCPVPVQCGTNEEYRRKPHNCKTCADLELECEESSPAGCYCKENYVRYPDGSCGRPRSCPPPVECSANEEYRRQPRNCATCDDPEKECEESAPAACYCKRDFVRFPDGTCGKPKQCPVPEECSTNAEYRKVPKNCGTCSEPEKECGESDVADCYCKRGYVKYPDGTCGRPKSCPPPMQCGKYEEYRRKPINCATCENLDNECDENATPACYCKVGYVRYPDGSCGRSKSCPPPLECPVNEEYRRHPNNCGTCQDPDHKCGVEDKSGCYCVRGLVRYPDGSCGKPRNCPDPMECGPNEQYRRKPTNCATCEEPHKECHEFEEAGCYCVKGTVRYSNGTCGNPKKCPSPVECGPNKVYRKYPHRCGTCADVHAKCPRDAPEGKQIDHYFIKL